MTFSRSVFLFLLGFLPLAAFSQSDSSSQVSVPNYLEIGGLVSSANRTPFWLQSNQFGTVPRSGSALTVRGGGTRVWTLGQRDSITEWRRQHTTSKSSPRWQAELGAEAVANLGSVSHLLLPQAYGAIRYGNWELFAGRRKQWFGLADSTLGTGSYIWSGNALPIPRIQFGLTRFTAVPFTQGWFWGADFHVLEFTPGLSAPVIDDFFGQEIEVVFHLLEQRVNRIAIVRISYKAIDSQYH